MSQLQPQQPVQLYPSDPNNFPNQQNNIPTQSSSSSSSSSSSHSNGSFVSVFIVLAIVLVISVIACVVGRICSKKSHGPKVKKGTQKQKEGKNKHNEFHQRDGDIEFGFDKRIASSKVAAAHGDHHHNPKGYKPYKNGGNNKGGVRFADDHIDFKPGPK